MCNFMGQADCQQYMGRVQGTGCAGGTGRTADTFHIQHNQQGLTLNELEAEVGIVRKADAAMSIQTGVRNLLQYTVNQIISQLFFLCGALFHGAHCTLYSLAQTYDARHVFGTCTTLTLLTASVNEGTQFQALADIQETDSFRTVQLMSAGAEHINLILIYIDRNLAESLYRIGMEKNAMLFCDSSNLLNRLNGADLIVCKHNGNQNSGRTDCLFQFLQLYHTVLIHVQISYLKTILLQPFAGMQNRMVLNLGGNDMISFILIALCSCLQRPVVRFAAACSKVNFI